MYTEREQHESFAQGLRESCMSQKALEAIVGRAALDAHYRELLFADPDQALAGYDLTKEERAWLLAVDAETLDAFAERLGVHMTRKRRRPGPQENE